MTKAVPARSAQGQEDPARTLYSVLTDARLLEGSAGEWRLGRLSGGHSHITWLVSDPQGGPRFVVKVAQQDGPLAPYDVAYEAAQTKLACDGGVPAPSIAAVLPDNALGSPLFVMDYVAGDAPGPERIQAWLAEREPGAADELTRVVLGVLDTMAAIGHAQVPDLDVPELYREHIAQAAGKLESATRGAMAFPESIALAREALLGHADVLVGPASLVHGDFRPGNFILGPGCRPTVEAVLDWERGMWGHPLHDLGYLRLPSMRRGTLVAGIVEDTQLAVLWRERHGADLDMRALDYLTILAIFTELCACLRALLSMGGRLDLLRMLPLIARHENDLIELLRRWLADGRAY